MATLTIQTQCSASADCLYTLAAFKLPPRQVIRQGFSQVKIKADSDTLRQIILEARCQGVKAEVYHA